MGRIGSEIRVSDCFHILSCVIVCAVVWSSIRDTRLIQLCVECGIKKSATTTRIVISVQ